MRQLFRATSCTATIFYARINNFLARACHFYGLVLCFGSKDGPEQVFGIQKIIMHNAYDSYEIDNDIALMKLDRPAFLSKEVGLVCLPNQDDRVATGLC